MNAKEINASFDLVGFVQAITPLKKSGAYWTSKEGCPMPGCSSRKDAFQIKRTATGDIWHCRRCTDDKYHSVIDFFMRFKNVDFKEALKMAGGEVEYSPAVPKPRQEEKIEFPSADWQAEAWQEVRAASDRLLGIEGELDPVSYAMQLSSHGDPVIGKAGREYLTGRGITRAAWIFFDLGYAEVFGRSAITIPYTDTQQITAVRYRFTDIRPGWEKCQYKKGSRARHSIFGLQTYSPDNKTLVIVEGELNAVSLWQVLPRNITILSCGGKTNGKTPMIKAAAAHFENILIWMDEAEDSQSMRAYINRPWARLLKSPVIEGVKYDANEMLQRGLLADFVAAEITEAEKAEA